MTRAVHAALLVALLGAGGPVFAQGGAPLPEPSAPAIAQGAPVIDDVSSRFPRGPFTAVSIAAGDPTRMAVGNENGTIGFTRDGGETVDHVDAVIYRKMDPVTLRGTGGYGALAMRPEEVPVTQPVKRHGHHRMVDPSEGSEDDEVRSLYQFMGLLQLGLPGGRYALWMSVADPVPAINGIAVPSDDGPMAIAALGGIFVSDRSRGSWLKAYGAPGIMPRQRDPMGLTAGIDPRDPRHMLAATDGMVLESNDGGQNFFQHRDPAVDGAWINRIIWDPTNPDLIFLVAADQIFLSQDGGKKFEPSFSAEGEIRDLSLSPDAAIVATSDGMYLAYSDRLDHVLDDKDLIGAIPWGAGILAATAEQLMYFDPATKSTTYLKSTSMRDPFLKLVGGPTLGWLVSRDAVLRIGDDTETERGPKVRLLMTEAQFVEAVVEHQGLHSLRNMRISARLAKLLPTVELTANGKIGNNASRLLDGTFPVSARQTKAGAFDRNEWTVWASWDLDVLLLGHNSNPNLIIPTQIRDKRKALFEQVERTYREAAQLASSLARVSGNEEAALLERMRLAELTSYLEFMCGRPIVGDLDL